MSFGHADGDALGGSGAAEQVGGEIAVVRYSDCRGAEPAGQAAQGFDEGGGGVFRIGAAFGECAADGEGSGGEVGG